MKILPLLSMMLCLSHGLIGQSSGDSNELSDQQARDILEKIMDDYESHNSHHISFDLKIELPGEAPQTKEGSLIQSGEKFELDIDDKLIISDDETVWLYLKNDNEVQINDADFGQDGEYMSPNTIFNLYKSDEFVFAIFQQSYENGKAITQIECKPRDPDSEYSKMRLTVEDHINAVKRFKIFAKDGSRFTMILNFHKKDVKLEEGTFRFDPEQYEDIIIEDLRF
ncbi:MAG: LolA family protein [Saprospiraceae bacterium]